MLKHAMSSVKDLILSAGQLPKLLHYSSKKTLHTFGMRA